MESFLTIAKWPLIFISILGVIWIIWWVFVDDSNDRTGKEALSEFFGVFERRNSVYYGIQILFLLLAIFSYAVFYQLPPATQQKLTDYWSKGKQNAEIIKNKIKNPELSE